MLNYLLDFSSSYGFSWNIILFLLVFCSILIVAVFIERLIEINRAEIDIDFFTISMRKNIRNGNLVEAIQDCEKAKGAVAAIVKAGLLKNHQDKERIESAMETAGLVEVARLEKHAKILSVIAHVAPLIGLLGTVIGFIQAFSEMRLSGLVDISTTRIGESMEYALITTAAGLVVAIPAVLCYNYIVSRIESLVLEMQTTSAEIIDLLLENKRQQSAF